MQNNILYSRIVEIVLQNRGRVKKIDLSTSLQDDLGVDGVDGEEIMTQYFDTFKIDSSDFVFTDYFGEEHFGFSHLIGTFTKKPFRRITIEHLINCAEKGKWNIPN